MFQRYLLRLAPNSPGPIGLDPALRLRLHLGRVVVTLVHARGLGGSHDLRVGAHDIVRLRTLIPHVGREAVHRW